MAQTFDLLITGATVVNHDGRGVRDIAIANGRIAAIGNLKGAKSAETLDAIGLHSLPGVIDSQVHFREPGLVHKEDLETGSRAAVAGGVTAVFEMPNTKPLTTSAEALAHKVSLARHRMFCDFAFFVGGTRENIADIPALEKLEGSAGMKVFMGSSTGDLLVDDGVSLDAIIAKISRRASFHAEDEARLKSRMDIRRVGRKGECRASGNDHRTLRPTILGDPHGNAAGAQFLGIAGGGGVATDQERDIRRPRRAGGLAVAVGDRISIRQNPGDTLGDMLLRL